MLPTLHKLWLVDTRRIDAAIEAIAEKIMVVLCVLVGGGILVTVIASVLGWILGWHDACLWCW